ncbi:MAG TPA: hypothetical protein VKU93_09990, partial [Terracidiphilus sp.]|nr:hypothetical protein [Terracidiphilus sp.]
MTFSTTKNKRTERTAFLLKRILLLLASTALLAAAGGAQQPAEPVDPNPINGETYYLINQLSGLQADLDGGSTTPGQPAVIEGR